MKIRLTLFLILIFSLLTPQLWAAPPSIVSSIPANGDLTADPSTFCIEITFNETMNGAGAWRYSSTVFSNGTSEWSQDLKTFRYCWNNAPTPIPLGSYWFEFNPAGHPDFKSAATGEALPTTRISFTVTADGSNDNNNNNVDNTPPRMNRTIPADGYDSVDKTTTCLVIYFNEDMDTNITSAWSSSHKAATYWPDELSTTIRWLDKRTLEICRNDNGDLAPGDYIFTLNPQGTMFPFTDVAGNKLPETEINFAVSGIFTYYIPYFSSANNHWTGLCISNNSLASEARITATLYNTNGTPISPNPLPPFTIAANGQYLGTVAAGLEATGWVLIHSNCSLSGLCLIGSNVMADIPFSSSITGCLMIPHVAQTNKWDTDIMVCNPNMFQTTITLTYYSRSGQETISPNHVLAAWGSAKYKFSDIFPNLSNIDGGKVKILVTQGGNITGFALYYDTNNGGSYLAGINADPIN